MEACKNAPQKGIVGRAHSAAAFELTRWAPSPEAAEYVEHFWSVQWNLPDGAAHDSTVITFPAMHLTHEWGAEASRHGHPLPSTLVHGVVGTVFRITLRRWGAVVGARFHAGGFAARYGCDASAYTGRIVQAAELFDLPLVVDDDRETAPSQLEAAIVARHLEPDPTYRALRRLLDGIRDDADVRRVQQVMERAPWSGRTTQKVFKHYVGVPAKWVLCRYRLQRAALEIESEPGVDFAELAVRHGWYDQAHFSHDFRTMLGCAPGEYAAHHGA
ncbi:MAG: helix-turn-helix domain-containing protein [Mycobacterium sp.]